MARRMSTRVAGSDQSHLLSQSLSNDISQTTFAHAGSTFHKEPSKAAPRAREEQKQKQAAAAKGMEAETPAMAPPGGHLPPMRHSESAAATLHDLPPLPLQQLQRASTANALVRLTHLPTPKGTLSSRLDFKLPSSPAFSSLSGLVGAHNLVGSERLHFLNLVEKSSEVESSGAHKGAAAAAYYNPAELERQRKTRAAAYDTALQQISRLGMEGRLMLESDKHSGGGGGDDGRAAAAAARRAEAAGATKREASNKVSDQQKKLRMSRSASGRVQARLLELRVDENARQELDRRVNVYKQSRADGRSETRDFIRENRQLMGTLSSAALLERKGDSSRQWSVKVLEVQSRLAEMESGREALRQQREQALLMQQAERLSPRELLAQKRTSTPSTPAAGAAGASARAMAPRERAAAAKLEQERRKRWLMLIALTSRASYSLDMLVWDRNTREENKYVDRAARLIQRKHVSKQMRKQLTALNRSVSLLRNNVARFAFEWRLRKKVRSMDTIREFLTVVSGKSTMQRHVHNFLYKVIRVQRLWRRYATIIAAQLGIFSIQFERQLHTRKSANLHLTADEHKAWTKKISKLMLAQADA